MNTYKASECAAFFKTKEKYGGLSNFAGGFPLNVNGIDIRTTEALYQACRFPDNLELQQRIIDCKSPMTAKMITKPFRNETRPDWDNVRIAIMFWCLRIKLLQNQESFGKVLLETKELCIVEKSSKDNFWGAIEDKNNPGILIGKNVLGLNLEFLRMAHGIEGNTNTFENPLRIPNFLLLGKPIETVYKPLEGIEKFMTI